MERRRSTVIQSKVVVIGTTSVGKTSILNRIMDNGEDNPSPTMTMSTFMKRFRTASINEGLIGFWDTAGQEQYRSLGPMYYKNSAACIVVVDITLPETIEEAKHYIDAYVQACNTTPKIIVAANKIDLVKDNDELLERVTMVESLGYPVYTTSAVTKQGIIPLYDALVNLLTNEQIQEDVPEPVNIEEPQEYQREVCC